LEHVRNAGVVGAGGAGFPTHAKLAASVDTVVINAAECEPLLHKDKQILLRRPEAVLAGLAAAMELTGAQRGVIGIKAKYTDVISALEPMLWDAVAIAPLQDAYPAGDEFILIHDVLGRVIPPGGLPLDVGAVSMNVETAYNVSVSSQRPVIEKFITIAGAVGEPVTLRVPVGTAMSECVAAAGGPTVDNPCYLVGGPMMGYLEPNHDAPVDKRTGGIIVLPADHVLVRRRQADWRQIARIGRSACDQCSFCTELCPRYLLGHPIEPHRAMRSLGFNLIGQANVVGTSFCCECNLCSLYSCPEGLDPKSVCAENKRRLATEGAKWRDPPFHPARAETLMPGRKAPMKRLMRKLDLARFNNVGPLRDEPLRTDRVGIKLQQHVGAPCQPAVQPGTHVTRGQLVGQVPQADGKAALGAAVHASIDGTVTDVADGVVWIERR